MTCGGRGRDRRSEHCGERMKPSVVRRAHSDGVADHGHDSVCHVTCRSVSLAGALTVECAADCSSVRRDYTANATPPLRGVRCYPRGMSLSPGLSCAAPCGIVTNDRIRDGRSVTASWPATRSCLLSVRQRRTPRIGAGSTLAPTLDAGT
jgi:hypothetical protein